MNIFGQTPWRNIRTDTACAPNGYSSSDTLSRPIVENVARIPRICTVCRHCEASCAPVRRNKMVRFLYIIDKIELYTLRTRHRCLLSAHWQQRNVYYRYRTGAAVLRCEIACGKLSYFYGGMNDCTEDTLIRHL